jgi:anti-anti-sigma regulatory factor
MTTDELVREAFAKLDGAAGELALDFTSVQHITPNTIGAMEKLAAAAEAKAVKVVLRGVHIDVYKVLKLVNLTPRFSFPA